LNEIVFWLQGATALEKAWQPRPRKEVLRGAFFWLTAFYFVYCARPAELVPGLSVIPVAKITGVLAAVSLFMSAGKTPRSFKDLPKEAFYLLLLIVILFASALLSPVWPGGAFFNTLDFAKVYIAWVLTFLLITTLKRLRRIIFIQSAAVAVVSVAAIVKGHSAPRLNGVIGGFYSNPNDMAFAIVLSLPFCMAFLLSAKGVARRGLWLFGILVMLVALMLTASRAGFIDLVISGTVCLWHFGVKGKRLYLIAGTMVVGAVLLLAVGGTLAKRFAAISGDVNSDIEEKAQGSYEERKLLMSKAWDAVLTYPVLGVGVGNFIAYSEIWKEVHVSYLQIAAEGGVPALILYILFFARGFTNLRLLKKIGNLDSETVLFLGALKGSLVGFVVGACFAPEAYQFFPYFTVCYTSVILAVAKERESSEVRSLIPAALPRRRFVPIYASKGRSSGLTPAL
jgi:O-antigen ligase